MHGCRAARRATKWRSSRVFIRELFIPIYNLRDKSGKFCTNALRAALKEKFRLFVDWGTYTPVSLQMFSALSQRNKNAIPLIDADFFENSGHFADFSRLTKFPENFRFSRLV